MEDGNRIVVKVLFNDELVFTEGFHDSASINWSKYQAWWGIHNRSRDEIKYAKQLAQEQDERNETN